MRWPRHTAYRASGVEWLGDLPATWDVLSLKRNHRIVNGATPESGEETYWDGEIVWYTPDDLGRNSGKLIRTSRRTLSREGLDACAATLVPPMSAILSTRAPIGHVALTEVEAAMNQGCRGIVPRRAELSSDFLYFSLTAARDLLNSLGKGTTFLELAEGTLGATPMPLPPPDEQRAIAHFLDVETAKLDKLVTKKLTLIERLREERASLITRTVTRGLPSEAAAAAGLAAPSALRATGIEWMPEVPAHWEVKRIKRAVEFREGPGIMAADFADEGTPLIRIAGLSGRTVTLDGCNYLDPALVEQRWKQFRVRQGDLLISGSASMGICCEVDQVAEGAIPYTGIIIIRPIPGESRKEFLRWFFLSAPFAVQAELARTGATIQHFGPSHLAGMLMALPPIDEQRILARFLDDSTRRIDALISKTNAAIERTWEFRAALIQAAITGKIDVRGAAP